MDRISQSGAVSGLESDLKRSGKRSAKVSALLKKVDADKQRILAESQADLGDFFLTQGQFDHAERVLFQALDRFPSDQGDSAPHRAGVLRNLAKIYRQREDFESAKAFLSEAIAADIRHYGAGHHRARETMADLQEVMGVMYRI